MIGQYLMRMVCCVLEAVEGASCNECINQRKGGVKCSVEVEKFVEYANMNKEEENHALYRLCK